MKIVSVQDMRRIDATTIDSGRLSSLQLMGNAGKGCAQETFSFLQSIHENHKQEIVILCGAGNNGGDGFVIARHLSLLSSIPMKIHCMKDLSNCSPDAKTMADRLPKELQVQTYKPSSTFFSAGQIIIDCLLGTGLDRPVKEHYAEIIMQVNQAHCPVIAIDIPSGLNGDTGEIMGAAIKAQICLGIGLPKQGYFINQGPQHCGMLRNIEIGFPQDIIDPVRSTGEAIFREDAQTFFTPIDTQAHKYQRGQVLVIGGSSLYPGAPVLSSSAALRSGAGIVVLASPKKQAHYHSLISLNLDPKSDQFTQNDLELIQSHFKKSDTILIGPGMCGESHESELLKLALQSDKKLIIDAGALLHLPKLIKLLPRKAPTVITPHLGELKRLGSELPMIRESELDLAASLASQYKIHLVFKGQYSKVFAPDGTYSYNTSGNAGLATAGSGDVLAGIIGAFTAQRNSNFLHALQSAVFTHGLCAEMTPHGQRGLIADDLITLIPKAIHSLSPFS